MMTRRAFMLLGLLQWREFDPIVPDSATFVYKVGVSGGYAELEDQLTEGQKATVIAPEESIISIWLRGHLGKKIVLTVREWRGVK